jgi:hypothetical protein
MGNINFVKKTLIIQLSEKMLGTVPKDPDIFSNYVQEQHKKKAEKTGAILTDPMLEEEQESIAELEENQDVKGWTGFMRDEQGLFIMNYMIKGFLKSSWETCQEIGHISKLPAYKKWIDKLIFITPRKIRFYKDPECIHTINEPHGALERPLRTSSPKGERVALAKSDYINEGTYLRFEISVLSKLKDEEGKGNKVKINDVLECFDYGKFIGLGQWRGSGGYGTFDIVNID